MFSCLACSRSFPLHQPIWRCPCGGRLIPGAGPRFDRTALTGRDGNLWRYREAYQLSESASPVSLGEGFTPLAPVQFGGHAIQAKLDYLCPTGSYKDRGSAVMLTQLQAWGLTEIVEDSSGNAGASVAAYAGLAGIRAHIYVPDTASAGKMAQIGLHGGHLRKIPGSREACAAAALQAAEGTFYASHNWSPHFLLGLKSAAYEIAEQRNWVAPDWVVTPAGNGGLAGGLYYGFRDLLAAGVIERMPRIAMAQAANCAPVYAAWKQGLNHVPAIEKQPTVAEGIASAQPVRGHEMLEALRGSNGVVQTVTEDEIWGAFESLAAQGLYVEPTSATAAAALGILWRAGTIGASESVVLYLTGSGLKSTETIARHFAGRF
ncbi:MAG: pyridoxal-phosphate dependent enzyme [Bryobacteraceae bacterium]|nr:pyridoxal-phosphate dependent enzyme [Bryobacteraceae bacterium]